MSRFCAFWWHFLAHIGTFYYFLAFFCTIWVFWAFYAVLSRFRFVVVCALFWVKYFWLNPCLCNFFCLFACLEGGGHAWSLGTYDVGRRLCFAVVDDAELDDADQCPEFLVCFLLGDGDGVWVLGLPNFVGGCCRDLGWGVAPKVEVLGCGRAVVGLIGRLGVVSCLQQLLLSCLGICTCRGLCHLPCLLFLGHGFRGIICFDLCSLLGLFCDGAHALCLHLMFSALCREFELLWHVLFSNGLAVLPVVPGSLLRTCT